MLTDLRFVGFAHWKTAESTSIVVSYHLRQLVSILAVLLPLTFKSINSQVSGACTARMNGYRHMTIGIDSGDSSHAARDAALWHPFRQFQYVLNY